jgi:hypothetical protein
MQAACRELGLPEPLLCAESGVFTYNGCFASEIRKIAMKRLQCLAAILSLASALPSEAAPAPWHKWRSVTGETVCAQTSPGPGWVRLEASYVDPRCQRRDDRAAGKTKNAR